MLRSLLIILSILLNFSIFAQSPVYQEVMNAKNSATPFKSTKLLKAKENLSQMARFQSAVSDGYLLEVDNSSLSQLNTEKPEAIKFEIDRGIDQKPLVLELVKQTLFTEDFVLKTDKSTNYPINKKGTHYRGIVQGDATSVVALSVFDDEVLSVINTKSDGNIVLGKTSEKTNEYILYKEKDVNDAPKFDCGTADVPLTNDQIETMKNYQQLAGKVNNCVNVYFELDYTLFQEKGSVEASYNFMAGIFNVVATLYQNEEIPTKISEMYVWTTEDPYNVASSGEALNLFRQTRSTFNGDLGHLVSRGAPKTGGIAWVNGLCSSYNYAYSYIYNYYHDLPSYSWTVNVIAHEMGHNLGSPHTHACTWNGNNTAIDGCGPAIGANEGCDGPLPSETGGTIMSYCHLLSGVGINFQNGFGQQPGDLIRSIVGNASCLSSCGTEEPQVPCPTITLSKTDVNCFGGNDGTATVAIDGGTEPFTITWSNGGNSLNNNNLQAGNHSVTVTDGDGCMTSDEVVITQPSASIYIDIAATNATSENAADGQLVVSAMGGTPPYTYTWANHNTTSNTLVTNAGTHTVTVTDTKGCSESLTYELGFDAVPCPTLFFSKMNVSCFGGNNGFASVNITGGTAPYQIMWENGSSNPSVGSLTAGDHSVTITDANECSVTETLIITQPDAALQINTNTSNASAETATDGTIDVAVTGGTTPYSFAWSDNLTTGNVLTGSAGIYEVTVTDGNGCSVTETYEIGFDVVEPTTCQPIDLVLPHNESFENDLGIFVQSSTDDMNWELREGTTPSRGTGPASAFNENNYLYLEASRNKFKTAILNTGCLDLTGLDKPIFSFAYHMYGFYMGSLSVKISRDGGLFETVFEKAGDQGNNWIEKEIDLSNYIGSNIDIQIEGTIGSRYKSDMAIDALYIGNKAEGCSIPEVDLVRNHASCNGMSDASAEINVLNYDTGYSIAWSTGETGTAVSNLTAGIYYVTVTASQNCFSEVTVRLREPSSIDLDAMVMNPTEDMANGFIRLNIMGGTAPYQIQWSNNSVVLNNENLEPGVYSVTVTDANGCSTTQEYTLDAETQDTCNDSYGLPFLQNWETGTDNFYQNMEDQMDWSIGTGSTPSPRTGPLGAEEGALYAFLEASKNKNNTGILTSPCIDLGGAINPNLTFSYSMYGAHTGTLAVEVSSDNGMTFENVWSQTGDQGSNWNKAFINLSGYANRTIKVRFVGTVGDGYRSDMAIDNIMVDDMGSTLPVAKRADGLVALRDLSIYPNTVFDWTTIEFHTTESIEITLTIVDLNGKPVRVEKLQSTFGKNQFELDMGQLEGGSYVVTVNNGSRVIAKKMIKVNW